MQPEQTTICPDVSRLRRALLLGLCLAGTVRPAVAAGELLTVLFPDIGEPYRKVFNEIVQGIEEYPGVRVQAIAVGSGTDLGELQASLKRSGARAVIALGRQGLKAAGGLDPGIVVAGGIASAPDTERWRGISLAPDPALLFAQLRTLVPGVRRVFAVFNPQQSAAVMRLAREAARSQGLELNGLEAADLASAVRRYESAFAGADGRRDAVWLPQDSVAADESTVLPLVLRESWERGVPLFSSSMLHVKKGVLFALYPNNVGLGRDLAALALGPEPRTPGLVPLRAVRLAFNIRTASHIGLRVDAEQQRSFSAVFP
ncbi:ABC transporter substrate-binding protein [Massilia sp. SM-13]|uniref:ABC transporter substrate-binding protein n=1 Tax=Pseudoduganella rhizocola TaxID=3382643 RepID=UPI0038B53CF6